MKINESTLTAFATSHDAPVDKEGWLWKKGEVNKAFQRRYFVLKGNLLFYFEKRTDKEPIGVIILEGCIVELAEEDVERFGFKISFHGEKTRVYHMATEFQRTLMEWMKLLACASHDYMKLMVFELQQKLIELDAVAQSASSAQLGQLGSSRSEPACRSERHTPFVDDTAREVLCPENDSPDTESWMEQHKSYGRQILSDYKKFLSNGKVHTANLIRI